MIESCMCISVYVQYPDVSIKCDDDGFDLTRMEDPMMDWKNNLAQKTVRAKKRAK